MAKTAEEKVFGTWPVKELLGEGAFGKVYRLEREDFGTVYQAAMKKIVIPQSDKEIQEAVAEGMDMQSVTGYFRSFVEEIVGEFKLMAQMKGNTNIVSYEDHLAIPHEDGIGWDILIRMELLEPVLKMTARRTLSEEEVIKLGIDMCHALEVCGRLGIIHRDIKPENIFVSALGDFKLGDFGIARTAEKTMSNLSRKGTYTYMAPEVYKGEPYNAGVDIYSLGIVMYRFLNYNRAPFLPPYPQPISFSDREASLTRRISGETMPPPACGRRELKEIVLRACSYHPSGRFDGPAQMREALEMLAAGERRAAKAPEAAIPAGTAFAAKREEELSVGSALGTKREEEPVVDSASSAKREGEPSAGSASVAKKNEEPSAGSAPAGERDERVSASRTFTAQEDDEATVGVFQEKKAPTGKREPEQERKAPETVKGKRGIAESILMGLLIGLGILNIAEIALGLAVLVAITLPPWIIVLAIWLIIQKKSKGRGQIWSTRS